MGALLATLPCGVVSFTDDGTVHLTNPTLRTLLGYQEGELEGRHVERLMTVAGRIFYQTHLFPLLRLHREAREIFLLLRHKDGGEVGALANAVRVERDGVTVNDLVLMEVRERRKYEDALLQARRDADIANTSLSARSRELQAANEHLHQLAEELQTQQELLEEQAAELETQASELESANLVLIRRSEELEQARAAADEANHAKTQFLTNMSHELRTPLNAIGGYAQLIELGVHGPVTDGQRAALDRIRRSQQHLLRLINEVLNLARIESGHIDYHIEEVPVAAVVSSVLPMVEPQMAAAELQFASTVPDGLTVRADRDKTQQILLNLLTNAVKFTRAGGSVRIDAGRDPAGTGVLLHLTDTGIGIPSDKLAGIFEPFVQVNASLTRTQEGTGLGLAISRDLARGMGGDLTVSSALGKGSTFTLALPGAR